MQTVHGAHHRGLVRNEDYKRHMKNRTNEILLSSIPDDEYVVISPGVYKCVVCSHLSPFTSGESLLAHCKGKKHLQRLLSKKTNQQQIEQKLKQEIPKHSMAMPSLVYRTNAITQRVLSSNHNTTSNPETIKEKKEQESSSQLPNDEPAWIKEMKKEKEEREMIAKGFKKDESGNWIRDEMVEFDSDEEPTL